MSHSRHHTSPKPRLSTPYQYAFNGMERQDEIAGMGNSYQTHFRLYDPRLGRWFSTDPLKSILIETSSYSNNNNNPVLFADSDGDIGLPTALAGGVVSGLVDLNFQVLDNMFFKGQDFNTAINTVSWSDIGVEFGKGFAAGFAGFVPVDKVSKLFKPRYRKAFIFMVNQAGEYLTEVAGEEAKSFLNGEELDLSKSLTSAGFSQLGSMLGQAKKMKFTDNIIEREANKFRKLVSKSKEAHGLAGKYKTLASQELDPKLKNKFQRKANRYERKHERFQSRAIDTAIGTYSGMSGEMFTNEVRNRIVSNTIEMTVSHAFEFGPLQQSGSK